MKLQVNRIPELQKLVHKLEKMHLFRDFCIKEVLGLWCLCQSLFMNKEYYLSWVGFLCLIHQRTLSRRRLRVCRCQAGRGCGASTPLSPTSPHLSTVSSRTMLASASSDSQASERQVLGGRLQCCAWNLQENRKVDLIFTHRHTLLACFCNINIFSWLNTTKKELVRAFRVCFKACCNPYSSLVVLSLEVQLPQ